MYNDLSVPIAKRNWSLKEKRLLKKIQKLAFVYEWLHDRTSHYYFRLFNYIALPAYLIHLLVAGGALSGLQNGSSQWVQACTVAFATIGMILKAVDDSKQFKQRALDHERVSIQFSELHRAIHREFCKPEIERQDGTYFIASQDEKFSQLMQVATHIPDHIVRQYEALHDDGEFESGMEEEFEQTNIQASHANAVIVSPFPSKQKVVAFQRTMLAQPTNASLPKAKSAKNLFQTSFLRSSKGKRPLEIVIEKSLHRN